MDRAHPVECGAAAALTAVGALIEARAAGHRLVADTGDDGPVAAEVWSEESVDDATEELRCPPGPDAPLRAMSHDELLASYPRSYHRDAAQQGGHLRDLRAVLAFDVPARPHQHHAVVHLDHHVDGRVTARGEDGSVALSAVDMTASAVRVVVYGRLVDDLEVAGTTVPAGTLATLLGVPQDQPQPQPASAWDAVRSMHLRA